MLDLVIDNREKSLFEYFGINDYTNYTPEGLIRKSLSIGDYAIVDSEFIYEIFERKTLEDYADSFKDGRHNNKNKLISLREISGCRIYYVVEGEPDNYNSVIHGIPYSSIEASMFNMMSNLGIFIIRTKNKEDTARMLLAKKVALMNSIKAGKFSFGRPVEDPIKTLTEVPKITVDQIWKEMYCQIPGVSDTIAEELAKKIRISDIILCPNEVFLDHIRVNNRRLSKSVINTIHSLDPLKIAEMFVAIPGIKNVTSIGDALDRRECNTIDIFLHILKRNNSYNDTILERIRKVLNAPLPNINP